MQNNTNRILINDANVRSSLKAAQDNDTTNKKPALRPVQVMSILAICHKFTVRIDVTS